MYFRRSLWKQFYVFFSQFRVSYYSVFSGPAVPGLTISQGGEEEAATRLYRGGSKGAHSLHRLAAPRQAAPRYATPRLATSSTKRTWLLAVWRGFLSPTRGFKND